MNRTSGKHAIAQIVFDDKDNEKINECLYLIETL